MFTCLNVGLFKIFKGSRMSLTVSLQHVVMSQRVENAFTTTAH